MNEALGSILRTAKEKRGRERDKEREKEREKDGKQTKVRNNPSLNVSHSSGPVG